MQAVINIFGAFDENMKALEKELDVTVVSRETEFKILGEEQAVEQAAKALEALLVLAERGDQISVQTVSYVLALTREGKEQEVRSLGQDVICITAKGKPIKAKTIGQKKYMEAMRKNTITMGIGPAGTGKTYLAVAAAVTAFREKRSAVLF